MPFKHVNKRLGERGGGRIRREIMNLQNRKRNNELAEILWNTSPTNPVVHDHAISQETSQPNSSTLIIKLLEV